MAARLALSLLLAALLAGCATAWNRRVALVVFGDSISDAGNFWNSPLSNRTGPRSPPYWLGRFTTEPGTWADQLPNYVKKPSQVIAPNFAFGGATACRYSFLPPVFDAFPSAEQLVDQYLAALARPNSTLVTKMRGFTRVPWLWLGANDVQYLSYVPADQVFQVGSQLPGNVSSCLANAARKLIQNGHKRVVISSMAPFEETPLAVLTNNSAIAKQLIALINGALSLAVNDLQAAYPNATVVLSTTYTDIVAATAPGNLTANGFKYATPATCFKVPANYSSARGDKPLSTCKKPDEFVFVDPLHPTPAGHRIAVRTVLKTLVNVLKLFPWSDTRYVPLAKK